MSQISELEWSEWSRCLAGHVKFNTGKKENNCSIMNVSTCRDRRVLREDGAVKRFHYIIKMLKFFFSSKSQRISKMFSPLYLCFYERNLMRASQGAPLQLSALRRTKMPTSTGLCHAEEWTHLAQGGITKFAQYTAFISFCGRTQLNTREKLLKCSHKVHQNLFSVHGGLYFYLQAKMGSCIALQPLIPRLSANLLRRRLCWCCFEHRWDHSVALLCKLRCALSHGWLCLC